MASVSRHIPKATKAALLKESGGKCANPGCDTIRLEIHHIKEWAAYKTHDEKHMIAICPTCHDAVHNGTLEISDDTLYEWKKIDRDSETHHTHLYIEPGKTSAVFFGGIKFQQKKEQKTILMKFENDNKLEFSVDDGWLEVSTTLKDRAGKIILQVTKNKLTINRDPDIKIDQRQGRFQITVPINKYYLPAAALYLMQKSYPEYGSNGTIIALDLEVVQPGHVRILGFWPDGNNAIVSTSGAINFCRPGMLQPQCIFAGGGSFIIDGMIDQSVFNFRK